MLQAAAEAAAGVAGVACAAPPALEPEPEPEPPRQPTAAAVGQLARTYVSLAAAMPAVERALVVENANPSGYTDMEVVQALGLEDTERDWATRQCSAADIQQVEGALSEEECAALRDAVDAAALSGKAVVGHGSDSTNYRDSEDAWQTDGSRIDFMQVIVLYIYRVFDVQQFMI